MEAAFQLSKQSRIYVAGHQGLIGSAVLRLTRRLGYENVVTRAHADLELTDPNSVRDFFHDQKPEVVVLAAGWVGGIVENRDHPGDFIRENLAIQHNTMSAALEVGVSRFVFFASSCMYPRKCPQPMAEDALLTGKPEPTSMAYAMAKLAGLHMCLAYNSQFGPGRFVPLIPNSAYGPNDKFDPEKGHVLSALISRFHEAVQEGRRAVTLWGSGDPRREFVHADDVASAVLFLLQRDTHEVELPINIGVSADYSIRELAGLIRDVVGFSGEIQWDRSKPDGAPRKLLDSSRIRALGWQPSTTLEKGVGMTYEWYLEHEAAER